MKSSIAIFATLSLAQAQSSGWQNTNPSVSELSQEKFRCGCPMPAPKVTGCQAALPVQNTGCGCQPASCNPKPDVPHPTKVLALQCHDVTSWKQETVTDQVERIRKIKIPKTKTVTRNKMGYKKTTAIRYRQKMVEVDEMKWETRQVQKTTYRTVTENVRVVAPPETRMDCCGRQVAMQRANPCSCAAPVKYTTKTISKQVPVNSMVTERVQVPCKVKKMVNEPYEVTVNMPMPGTETVEEKYFEYKDERYTEPVKRTTRIPIVTRQCTDASGKMIKISEVSQVPLHHSGPAPEKQAGRFVQSAPLQAQAVQMTSQTQVPARTGCAGNGCKPLSAFQRASLVNAPVDRMIGTGSLVQVGVVDPRLRGPNASGWANSGKNMMQGQWGGAYLAEKDAEVTEASESDADE